MQRPMHRQECAVVMCEFFLTLLSLSLSLSLSIYLSWKRMLMWIIMFVPKTLYCCCCYARRCAPFFSSLWNANFCVHLFFTSKWAQNKYWSVLCACTECIFAYIYSSCISTVNSSTAESKHDQRKATQKKTHEETTHTRHTREQTATATIGSVTRNFAFTPWCLYVFSHKQKTCCCYIQKYMAKRRATGEEKKTGQQRFSNEWKREDKQIKSQWMCTECQAHSTQHIPMYEEIYENYRKG